MIGLGQSRSGHAETQVATEAMFFPVVISNARQQYWQPLQPARSDASTAVLLQHCAGQRLLGSNLNPCELHGTVCIYQTLNAMTLYRSDYALDMYTLHPGIASGAYSSESQTSRPANHKKERLSLRVSIPAYSAAYRTAGFRPSLSR